MEEGASRSAAASDVDSTAVDESAESDELYLEGLRDRDKFAFRVDLKNLAERPQPSLFRELQRKYNFTSWSLWVVHAGLKYGWSLPARTDDFYGVLIISGDCSEEVSVIHDDAEAKGLKRPAALASMPLVFDKDFCAKKFFRKLNGKLKRQRRRQQTTATEDWQIAGNKIPAASEGLPVPEKEAPGLQTPEPSTPTSPARVDAEALRETPTSPTPSQKEGEVPPATEEGPVQALVVPYEGNCGSLYVQLLLATELPLFCWPAEGGISILASCPSDLTRAAAMLSDMGVSCTVEQPSPPSQPDPAPAAVEAQPRAKVKRASKKKPSPPELRQCFNCQLHGHEARDCQNQRRCTRCGAYHRATECTTAREEAVCCNCGLNHAACFSGCEMKKQLRAKHRSRAATAPRSAQQETRSSKPPHTARTATTRGLHTRAAPRRQDQPTTAPGSSRQPPGRRGGRPADRCHCRTGPSDQLTVVVTLLTQLITALMPRRDQDNNRHQ